MKQMIQNEGCTSSDTSHSQPDLDYQGQILRQPPPPDECCECCGKHISKLPVFSEPDETRKHNVEGKLVKRWRPLYANVSETPTR